MICYHLPIFHKCLGWPLSVLQWFFATVIPLPPKKKTSISRLDGRLLFLGNQLSKATTSDAPACVNDRHCGKTDSEHLVHLGMRPLTVRPCTTYKPLRL